MSYIKFLGTAGARFVMINQLRYSAGLWINYRDTNIIIDPGPGALIRVLKSRPKLKPSKLDGIILTHKHIDHSNDVNVLAEAMTAGGFKKRGILIAPGDCFGKGGVIFDYVTKLPLQTRLLKKGKFKINDLDFQVPSKLKHSVNTYGLKFRAGKSTVSLISDTGYFNNLADLYRADIMVINVVFKDKREDIEHLCIADAKKIITKAKPKIAVLTHFGMTMLKAKPHIIEEKMARQTGVEVKCAYDGMTLNLDFNKS